MSDNDDYRSSYPSAGPDSAAPRGRSRSPGGGANGYSNGGRGGGDVVMREADGDRGRGDEAGNQGTNLHVSGLAPKVEMRDLENLFSTLGKVVKASVMYDPHTRESRGFGFVMMSTQDEADRAIAELDGKELSGKIIKVAQAKRSRARTPTPGRYYGPPKTSGYPPDRAYQPRSYDNRYASREPRYDDRDRYYDRRYDDRRDARGYDDRREYRDYGRGGGGGGGGYEDRYSSSRGDYRAPPPPAAGGAGGYEDRRRGGEERYGGGERSRY